MRALARSLVRDTSDADDVVQDAALAAVERPPSEGTPPRAWFVRVIRNLAARRYRADRRRGARERAVARPESVSPTAHVAEELEVHRLLVAAVSELDDPYRTAVVLRYFDGLSPREIARRVGVPSATASTWVHRGLATLRGRLDREREDWRVLVWLVLDGPPDGAAVPAPTLPLVPLVGAAAMATKKTIGVVALVLLALAVTVGVVAVLPASETDTPADTAKTEAPASAPPEARRGERGDHARQAEVDPLPPPFDLTTADRDLDLFGRVVDPEGLPVAGAVLTPLYHLWKPVSVEPPPGEEDPQEGEATRSARDGSFRLRLTRGAVADLRVAASGYAGITLAKCSAGERRTITLMRGTTLRVRCVDGEGHPVQGVVVTVSKGRQGDPIRQEREGSTDAAGRIEFGCLVPGIARVSCQGSSNSEYPTLTFGTHTELELVLPPARAITGRITDADTGRPLAGVQVSANWIARGTEMTDADGRYRVGGFGGTTSLTARLPGYDSLRLHVGDAATLDFQLRAGGSVRGRLLRPDGTPAGGARVGARSPFTRENMFVRIGTTADADGRFEIAGLRRGATCTLTAVAEGCGKLLLDYEQAGPVVDLGDIDLSPPRSIEGLVTDADGNVFPDASVWVRGGDDDRGRLGATPAKRTPLSSEERRTDDLGRFRFVGLAPGTYSASLRVPGAPTQPSVELTLPPDRDLVDVRLTTSGSRTLTLHVTDAAGTPLPGIGFSASGRFGHVGGSTYPLSGATDANGRAVLRGLPPADMTVLVNNMTAETRWVMEKLGPLVPENQVVHVVLRRAVFVSGVMRDAAGTAVPHLGIAADSRSDGTQLATDFGDDEARFSIKVPEGVPVDLRITGMQSYRRGNTQGQMSSPHRGALSGIVPPATNLVVLVTQDAPEGDRTLDVIVRDSTGQPVAKVDVHAFGRSFPQGVRARTDADGRVHFENLPQVSLTVSAFSGNLTAPPQPLDVPPANVDVVPNGQEVTLRYVRGDELRGVVESAVGKPVPRAHVRVMTHDYRHYRLVCDEDGRFRCGGLPGLAHRLTASIWIEGKEFEVERQGLVPGPDSIRLRLSPRAD